MPADRSSSSQRSVSAPRRRLECASSPAPVVRSCEVGDWLVVQPEGELDIVSVPFLGRSVQGRAQLVFDLSQTTFIDASFLNFLARTANERDRVRGVVRVAMPSPQARRLLALTALDQRLGVGESLSDDDT